MLKYTSDEASKNLDTDLPAASADQDKIIITTSLFQDISIFTSLSCIIGLFFDGLFKSFSCNNSISDTSKQNVSVVEPCQIYICG